MITTMADREQSKAERRPKSERREAKAKRRKDRPEGESKAERKRARRAAHEPQAAAPLSDATVAERIDSRLASLEEAVAVQAELSEELLDKLDAMLREASSSATPSQSLGD
jgi:hypothetical protein